MDDHEKSPEHLAGDLRRLESLQRIGALFIAHDNVRDVLEEILEAAIDITHADMGNIQLVDRCSGNLKIAVHRGFDKDWLNYWDEAHEGRGACGTALQVGKRIIVEDVVESPIFKDTPALDIQLRAGVRAVQSTPLVGRAGAVIGIISTHFKTPGKPDDKTFQFFDLLARQATDIIERSQIEAELRESEKKYRAFLNHCPAIAWMKDDKGRHVYLNPTCESRFNVQWDDWRGKTDFEVWPHPVAEQFWENDQMVLASNRPAELVEETVDREGQRAFWFNIKFPFQDLAGNRYVGGIGIDITQNKKNEEALRQSEEKYRLIFNNSPVGLMHFNSDGILIDCNDKFAEIAGASREQVVGFNLLTSLKNEGVKEAVRQALSGKVGTYEGEYTSVTGGRSRFLKVTYAPLHVPGADGSGGIAIADDITDRKLAEEARIQSEEKYRRIVDTTNEGIWAMDESHVTTFVNDAMARMLGYTVDEMIGKTVEHFILDEELEDHRKQMEARHFGRNAVLERRYRRKDGATAWLRVSATPMMNQNGEFLGAFGMFTDLSELKSLQAQLLQSQKMQAIGSLATGIAHDFNNMLAIIMGYSSFLLDELTEGDRGFYELQRIVITAKTAADVVQRLLAFSGQASIKPVLVNLNSLINDVMKVLAHTLPREIDIQTRLSARLQLVKADKSMMSQMVMILTINAAEAMPEGGRLTIQTENVVLDDEYCRMHTEVNPGAYVILTVSDTGRGIDKLLLDRILDPYYTTKPLGTKKGTGLGLPVVQGIVAQHQGHITVESEVGKGTTFWIYLPSIEEEQAPGIVQPKMERPVGGTETILLVEDEELVRELGKAILQQFGYAVLTASEGVEALDVYRKEQSNISLVILDIVMPRMGGKECLEALLTINPAVKVVVSSRMDTLRPVKNLVRLGAKGAVNKPFSMRELLGTVRAVLDAD